MTDIQAEIAEHIAHFTEALGGTVTDLQLHQIRRAAEQTALADALRGQAIDGVAVDLGELVRIEAMADEAIAKLNLPIKPAQPAKLEVRFIDPRLSRLSDSELERLEELMHKIEGAEDADDPTPEDPVMAHLRGENARLRREIDQLTERYSGIIRNYERAR